MRLERVTSLFHTFEELNDDLEILDPQNNSIEEINEIQTNFYTLASKITDHLKIHDSDSSVSNSIANSILSNDANVLQKSTDNGTFKNVVKLPPLELPKFNGHYENWVTFEDSFKSMIHDNPDLSKVQKFHYLKSALEGAAEEKINDANYEVAWEMLRKSYKAKRVLISRYLSLLLELPLQQKESHEGLSKLATSTRQIIASLSALNVKPCDELIVCILESKMHKTTREKWEEGLSRDEYPTLQSVYDFLDRYAIKNVKFQTKIFNRTNASQKLAIKKGDIAPLLRTSGKTVLHASQDNIFFISVTYSKK